MKRSKKEKKEKGEQRRAYNEINHFFFAGEEKSIPSFSLRFIVAPSRIGQDPRADPLSKRIETSLLKVTFARQPISMLFPSR